MPPTSNIERLAMVGEKKWQQNMAALCKPFTKAKIRYFDHADATGANGWSRHSDSDRDGTNGASQMNAEMART